METGNVILGVILITISILPFYLMHRHKAGKRKKVLASLKNLAETKNCSLADFEYCGDIMIGIDVSNTRVFFIRKTKSGMQEFIIDLTQMKTCKVNNTSRSVGSDASSVRVIEMLELSFIPKNKMEQPVDLPFFIAEENGQLSGELHAVEKWAARISGLIS